MSDLTLMCRLMDDGLSTGEAARVVQQARASLDSITETVELAAARILAGHALELETVAADYRSAGQSMRRAA